MLFFEKISSTLSTVRGKKTVVCPLTKFPLTPLSDVTIYTSIYVIRIHSDLPTDLLSFAWLRVDDRVKTARRDARGHRSASSEGFVRSGRWKVCAPWPTGYDAFCACARRRYTSVGGTNSKTHERPRFSSSLSDAPRRRSAVVPAGRVRPPSSPPFIASRPSAPPCRTWCVFRVFSSDLCFEFGLFFRIPRPSNFLVCPINDCCT